MQNPYVTTDEAHFDIEESASRLGMPVQALVERIRAGEVQTKFNGRRNYIAAGEVDRLAVALAQQAREAQAVESERAAQEQKERDGVFIAREMVHLQELAKRYGYVPPGKE